MRAVVAAAVYNDAGACRKRWFSANPQKVGSNRQRMGIPDYENILRQARFSHFAATWFSFRYRIPPWIYQVFVIEQWPARYIDITPWSGAASRGFPIFTDKWDAELALTKCRWGLVPLAFGWLSFHPSPGGFLALA